MKIGGTASGAAKIRYTCCRILLGRSSGGTVSVALPYGVTNLTVYSKRVQDAQTSRIYESSMCLHPKDGSEGATMGGHWKVTLAVEEER